MAAPTEPSSSAPVGGTPSPSRARRFDIRQLLFLVLACIAIAYVILIPFGAISREDRLSSTEVVLVAVLLAIASNLPERLAELSFGGFKATFESFQARQDSLEDQVQMLGVLLGGLMTSYEYEKLHYLAVPNADFMVEWHERMKDELYHLDALRYIKVLCQGGIEQLANEQRNSARRFNLKEYVQITDRGRAYLALREKYVPLWKDEDWGRRVAAGGAALSRDK
jgi:hypothetical protein